MSAEVVRDGYRRLPGKPQYVYECLDGSGRIVVTGVPSDEEDETHRDYHSCDEMGCGSADEHILLRAVKRSNSPTDEAEAKGGQG